MTVSLREEEGCELELQRITEQLRKGGYNASANIIERYFPDVINFTQYE